MIRYMVPLPPLDGRVDPNWLKRAHERTKKFVKTGKFNEKKSIWSEVKPVFMALQFNKCAFCERQLEGPLYGTIEHDLEHFRPKSSVSEWPGPNHPRGISYTFSTGGNGNGYYWLAYDLSNYAAACKTCNSPLKSNNFPIGGKRGTHPADFAALSSERAYLCLPIGNADADPETLVSFTATTAIPAAKRGVRNRRGRIIIDFFELNGREHLHRDRARMLILLYYALEASAVASGPAKAQEDGIIEMLTSPNSPHTGCCRAFQQTWQTDRNLGRRLGDACKAYVASPAGTSPP